MEIYIVVNTSGDEGCVVAICKEYSTAKKLVKEYISNYLENGIIADDFFEIHVANTDYDIIWSLYSEE